MNNYKNPHSTTIGTEGAMFNEAMKMEKKIDFNHYGIFSNDNTYAVSFNPNINRPPMKYFQNKPIKPPHTNQHITKPINEPPVSITDGGYFMKKDKPKEPPLLPPYLKKPEKLGEVQGKAHEKDKGQIIYGPKHKVKIENIVY